MINNVIHLIIFEIIRLIPRGQGSMQPAYQEPTIALETEQDNLEF